jgi:hypothetical protein
MIKTKQATDRAAFYFSFPDDKIKLMKTLLEKVKELDKRLNNLEHRL